MQAYAEGYELLTAVDLDIDVPASLRRVLLAVTFTGSLAEVGHTVIGHAAALRGEPASFEELGSGTALGRRAADAGLPADGAPIVALVRCRG